MKKPNPRDSTASVSAGARERAVARLTTRLDRLEQRLAQLETTIKALKKILKPWPI
jgi:hypothetical protein